VGSPAIYKDLLFVPTGNGVDADHPGAVKVRAPEAPSPVCLNKRTEKVVWKDNSPGKEGYGGNHASPLIVDIAGKVQVIHPQADGWVRSFEALTGKLVWKFDSNRKEAKWDWLDNQGTARHVVVATPVYAEKYVYFGAGREAAKPSSRYFRGGCSVLIQPRWVTSAPSWKTEKARANRIRTPASSGITPRSATTQPRLCFRLHRVLPFIQDLSSH